MAGKNLRKLGMDPMERLYYERKDRRKRAYDSKRRKALSGSRSHPAGGCWAGRAVAAAPAQEAVCTVRVM